VNSSQLDLPAITWESVGLGAAVLVAGLLLAWVVRRAVRPVLRWRGRTESSAVVFAILASWLVAVLAFAAALTVVFPSIRPVNILGGVGVISIAAGIAFQTVLGNMFAGIVLLFRDRLEVGDQVGVKGVRGTIVAIDLSSTTVRTFDGRQVLIPNSVMHSEVVTVQTGFEAVRTTVAVALDEAADLVQAQQVAVRAMRGCPQTLDEPSPEALLSEIGNGTVTLDLRFWSGALQLETREAQHAVIVAVMRAFAEEGVPTGSDALVVRLAPPADAAGAPAPDAPAAD
jgi:small-conductance mechanosensitive channel